ncbi:MAG: peptidoglycan binding domain-containing protein [Lachnospiraceae bacterium]|nr:peptidoglycan binding domain-containing protein [Lachnospiraceae bacterium]
MTGKVEKAGRGAVLYIGIAGGAAVCLTALYLLGGLRYKSRFFPNVTINGINVSGKTADQVRADLSNESQNYALRIEERDDGEEFLYGEDFGLTFYYEDTLTDILADQEFWKWGMKLLTHTELELPVRAEYDDVKLKSLVKGLSCTDITQMVEPENAYLTYDAENGIHIVPENRGNMLSLDDFYEQVVEAVENARQSISLESLGLYEEPEISKTDEALNEKYNLWKPYLETKIVYHFDDETEILDGSIFYEWMSEDAKGKISFDKEQIKDYVRGLARKYNTAYSSKELETSYGETVTIIGGPYGWLINQPDEADALEAALLACESQDREPVYYQTAASHTQPDYGDTYVEINLSAQHLFFYKDGELIVESDFVSGNESRGWATPAGAFPLTYKERNATLKGENYATPVSYWMPFNGNIGMHDSSWRKSYGKNIYKKNGSHGCINLPPDVAAVIYENIEKGMPVLCYYLSGTEWVDTNPKKEESTNPSESGPELPDNAVPTDPNAVQPDNTVPADPNLALPDNTVPADPSAVQPDNAVPADPSAVQPENTIPADPNAVQPDNTVPADPNPAVPENNIPADPNAALPQNPL